LEAVGEPRPDEVKARRPPTPPEPSLSPRPAAHSLRDAAARAPVAAPHKAKFPDTFRERQSTPTASEPAGAGRRLVAAFLDHVIIGLIQGAVLAPVLWYWWSRPISSEAAQVGVAPVAVSLALVPVAVVLTCLYFIYGWGVLGATPGKRIMGIAVEGEDGTFPIGAPRAAARFLGYLLSGALLGIGYAMILFGGKGLHDRIAGTRVMPRERA
ncbi:MAG: RDD family protein, partial [Vicinamibacteria bacterium]